MTLAVGGFAFVLVASFNGVFFVLLLVGRKRDEISRKRMLQVLWVLLIEGDVVVFGEFFLKVKEVVEIDRHVGLLAGSFCCLINW